MRPIANDLCHVHNVINNLLLITLDSDYSSRSIETHSKPEKIFVAAFYIQVLFGDNNRYFAKDVIVFFLWLQSCSSSTFDGSRVGDDDSYNNTSIFLFSTLIQFTEIITIRKGGSQNRNCHEIL